MKNGNMKEQSGGYSLGTLTGSAFYEGPIKKDTSSFLISCRRTLFDLMLSTYNFIDSKGQSDGGYSLWDINGKYNYKLNEDDRIFVSFYKGRDILKRKNTSIDQDNNYTSMSKYSNYWGNSVASVRLNHRCNDATYASFILGVSNYEYVIQNNIEAEDQSFKGKSKRLFSSDKSQYIFSSNFENQINSLHYLTYGVNSVLHHFVPAKNEFKRVENQNIVCDSIWGDKTMSTPEVSAYFSDKLNVTDNLNFEAGCDWVVFGLKISLNRY